MSSQSNISDFGLQPGSVKQLRELFSKNVNSPSSSPVPRSTSLHSRYQFRSQTACDLRKATVYRSNSTLATSPKPQRTTSINVPVQYSKLPSNKSSHDDTSVDSTTLMVSLRFPPVSHKTRLPLRGLDQSTRSSEVESTTTDYSEIHKPKKSLVAERRSIYENYGRPPDKGDIPKVTASRHFQQRSPDSLGASTFNVKCCPMSPAALSPSKCDSPKLTPSNVTEKCALNTDLVRSDAPSPSRTQLLDCYIKPPELGDSKPIHSGKHVSLDHASSADSLDDITSKAYCLNLPISSIHQSELLKSPQTEDNRYNVGSNCNSHITQVVVSTSTAFSAPNGKWQTTYELLTPKLDQMKLVNSRLPDATNKLTDAPDNLSKSRGNFVNKIAKIFERSTKPSTADQVSTSPTIQDAITTSTVQDQNAGHIQTYRRFTEAEEQNFRLPRCLELLNSIQPCGMHQDIFDDTISHCKPILKRNSSQNKRLTSPRITFAPDEHLARVYDYPKEINVDCGFLEDELNSPEGNATAHVLWKRAPSPEIQEDCGKSAPSIQSSPSTGSRRQEHSVVNWVSVASIGDKPTMLF